jgi:hypothetical protein
MKLTDITAFFDASGKLADSRFVVVAGYLTTKKQYVNLLMIGRYF